MSSSCTPGNYCLGYDATGHNASTSSTPDAVLTLDTMIPCNLGYYCPGDESATVCPQGYYCPEPTQMIECPSGYYCPPQSSIPRECSAFSYCPSNSSRYFNWGCLLLLLLVIAAYIIGNWSKVNRVIFRKINTWFAGSKELEHKDTLFAASNALTNNNFIVENDKRATLSREQSSALASALKPIHEISIRLDHINAKLQVKGVEKTLVNDISAIFEPRTITAVMGPSGAGKSTLADVMLGQRFVNDGTVSITVKNLSTNEVKFLAVDQLSNLYKTGIIGFVPQSDIMLPELSAREILLHAANIRLGKSYDYQQRVDRVNHILALLNLTSVADTPVGDEFVRGISGGEKKRVSIGIELISFPSLLILDECTTGLDSSAAMGIMRLLEDIAHNSNVSVITILHQPRTEIFSLLDNLLLLGSGGYTVYFGPAIQAKDYFVNIGYDIPLTMNLADFFLDAITGRILPINNINNNNNNDVNQKSETKLKELENNHNGNKHSSVDHSKNYSVLVQSWLDYASFHPENLHLNKESDSKTRAYSIINDETVQATAHQSNWFYQVFYFTIRSIYSLYFRRFNTIRLEVILHVVTGAVIGLAFVQDNWFLPPIPLDYVPFCPGPLQDNCFQDAVRNKNDNMRNYIIMGLGVLCAIIGYRPFGEELNNISREIRSGSSGTAYFIGKTITEISLMVVYSFLFCVAFVLVSSPTISFQDLYTAVFLFEFTVMGIGNVTAFLLGTENALILCVVAALVGVLASDGTSSIHVLCWARWFGEAFYIQQLGLQYFTDPQTQARISSFIDDDQGYKFGTYTKDLLVLLLYGVVLRIWAMGLLVRQNATNYKYSFEAIKKRFSKNSPAKQVTS